MSDFRKELGLNTTKGVKQNLRNSRGTREAYYWCVDTYGKQEFNREVFSKIIHEVNRKLYNKFLVDGRLPFPEKLGELIIRKSHMKGVYFEDGKVKTDYSIDWANTIKLWRESPEDFEKRTIIRIEKTDRCRISFDNMLYKFKNNIFLMFKTNSFLKKDISNVLLGNKIPIYNNNKETW